MKIAILAAALLASACAELEELDAADVTITVCPADLGSCPLVADGAGQVPIRITVSAPAPHPDVKARLRLSSGTFAAPSDVTRQHETEVAIAAGDSAVVTVVAPLVPGPVRIDATVGGLEVTQSFSVKSADVEGVEIIPSPARLGNDTPIALQVVARAPSGKLSTGSTVELRLLDLDPDTAYAQVFAASGVLDGSGGFAATLHKEATLRAITVEATVTPPERDGIRGMSRSGRLVLTAP